MHPFNELRSAGISVSLNSDDPPYFATTIGREYEIAGSRLGLDDRDLVQISEDALVGVCRRNDPTAVTQKTRHHNLKSTDGRGLCHHPIAETLFEACSELVLSKVVVLGAFRFHFECTDE